MELSPNGAFLLLSSDDRAARRDGNPVQGHLYLMELKSGQDSLFLLTGNLDFPFFPHGISLFPLSDTTYRVWVINHANGRHLVEVFQLSQLELRHERTIEGAALISPNDLVAIDENKFFITNDHGYSSKLGVLFENYLGLMVSNVQFFDGESFSLAAGNISYANGIAYDFDLKMLYVAASRSFSVHSFKVGSNYELEKAQVFKTGTGVDNITLDQEGNLWIGCHPNLLAFNAYAGGKKEISPSEIVVINPTENAANRVQSLFVDDGSTVSAASVAVPVEGKIYVGTVMDSHIFVLERDRNF